MQKLVIDLDVPMTETRGRPPSEEHIKLLKMPVGGSFTSSKTRGALYQVARALGIKVRVLSEGAGKWRVWKRSLNNGVIPEVTVETSHREVPDVE